MFWLFDLIDFEKFPHTKGRFLLGQRGGSCQVDRVTYRSDLPSLKNQNRNFMFWFFIFDFFDLKKCTHTCIYIDRLPINFASCPLALNAVRCMLNISINQNIKNQKNQKFRKIKKFKSFWLLFDYLIIWLFDYLNIWLFDYLIIWLFDYLRCLAYILPH